MTTVRDPLQEIPRNLSMSAAVRLARELGVPIEEKSKHVVLKFPAGGNYSVSRGKKDAGLPLVKRLRRLWVEKYGEPVAKNSPGHLEQKLEKLERRIEQAVKKAKAVEISEKPMSVPAGTPQEIPRVAQFSPLPRGPSSSYAAQLQAPERTWVAISQIAPYTIWRHHSGYYTYARGGEPSYAAPQFSSMEAASVAVERLIGPLPSDPSPRARHLPPSRLTTAPKHLTPEKETPVPKSVPVIQTTIAPQRKVATPTSLASQDGSIRIVERKRNLIVPVTQKKKRQVSSLAPDEVAIDFTGRISFGSLVADLLKRPERLTLVADSDSFVAGAGSVKDYYRVALLQAAEPLPEGRSRSSESTAMLYEYPTKNNVVSIAPWGRLTARVGWLGWFQHIVMDPGERRVFKASAERVQETTYIVLDMESSRRADVPRRNAKMTTYGRNHSHHAG